MSAATSATRGLSTQDVESIRAGLAAGRRPKVVFTEAAGQIVGQTGQVVELTDPDGSEDFLVVRFGRDELPFSPADLAIAPKTPPRKAAKPEPEFKLNQPPAPTEEKETMSISALDEQRPADGPVSPSDQAPPADGDAAAQPAAARKATKAAKAAKPKAPAGLTVTLAYADGEWTVGAQQGTKVLAKPYVVKAAEAVKMVGMLDVPGVQEAVEQIVSNERAEALNQAERLRAELAEIEAKLAELGEDVA